MIICLGEALIDMVRREIPGGGEAFLPLPGGSPYNTAVAIGRLGTPVKFLGCLSRDFFGEILLGRLRENGVGDELIARTDRNSTLAFVRLEPGKEPRYVFYTEETADRSFSAGDLEAKLPGGDLPPGTRCILFGSISMTMEPAASTIESLVLAQGRKETGPVISLDPNIRPFMIPDRDAYVRRFESWLSAVTIVKISEADLEYIYPGLGREKALNRVLSLGPALAVCTLGPAGAEALTRRESGSPKISVPAADSPVADTIGAGDTFHGALLSWLESKGRMSRAAVEALDREELREALRFANRAAALVCGRRGAEPPTRAEVEALRG
ncbi:MAG: carbohydrate kinase [Treponema sp.]|jgi:fructokinase|nr:carbohydrate kinase [Treponema sp.]